MSTKVNEFLKEMTEATGLYGEDLFVFIKEKCLPKKVEKKQDDAFFPHGDYTFTGTPAEIKEFYLQHGGDRKVAEYFGCSAPGLVVIHVAALLKKERLSWVRPIKLKDRNGTITDAWRKYSCWFMPETGKYDFDDDGEILRTKIL